MAKPVHLQRRRAVLFVAAAVILLSAVGFASFAAPDSPTPTAYTSPEASPSVTATPLVTATPTEPTTDTADATAAADPGTTERPDPTATAQPTGSPSATPTSAPMPTPTPDESEPVTSASGDLTVVEGGGDVAGDSDNVLFYKVAVEDGVPNDPLVFAGEVNDIIADDRGWTHEGEWAFKRIDNDAEADADFMVVLAAPDTVDDLCEPLDTHGHTSCFNGEQAVINQNRWVEAVPHYDDDLGAYREYVINHEVGHALGFGHEDCPGDGELAPVMQQQTYSLDGCDKNPWPYP